MNRKFKIFHLECFIGINTNNESPVGRKLTIHSEKSNGEYGINWKRNMFYTNATFNIKFSSCDNISLWN